MLEEGFKKEGVETLLIRPSIVLGFLVKNTYKGIGKWLAYIDKWIVFPFVLIYTSIKYNNEQVGFHICDHSNAPYLKLLPKKRTVITCHDVLAIRGGLGHADAYCKASLMGTVLQKWILHYLGKANFVAAVSQQTLMQLLALNDRKIPENNRWRVIHNSFNGKFGPVEKATAYSKLKGTGLNLETPFILHVGSGLKRKNRKMLLEMVYCIGKNWDGEICFAGESMDEELLNLTRKLKLHQRVVSIVKPDHDTLVSLYNTCEAFIFPSFSEGFGWPLIEAQACGAPVIASSIAPFREISGRGALLADPNKPDEFADAFLYLKNGHIRAEMIAKGFENISRFSEEEMINGYLDLHKYA